MVVRFLLALCRNGICLFTFADFTQIQQFVARLSGVTPADLHVWVAMASPRALPARRGQNSRREEAIMPEGQSEE